MEIASHCEQFSLVHLFVSLDDVRYVLMSPSMQMVKAFDEILIETTYTKQILTLDVPSDEKMITFWDSRHKLSQEAC